ncbi:MAG: N-acetylmuramic acid 6-phosphate etherase [Clostridia bacterium]
MDYTKLKTEAICEKSKNIDKMSSFDIAKIINEQDKTVAFAVEKSLADVAKGIDCLADVLKNGGRIFYVGAGTSGRLGVLDASECPPTFGVSAETVVGIIAGGNAAAFKSIEDAEDLNDSIINQLKNVSFSKNDACVGISASGTAECVIGALDYARSIGAKTLAVSNNTNSPLIDHSDITIIAEVGGEVIKGSTRMKAGTAQKMIINMLSTGAMVKFGRTRGNLMAFMTPSNKKLVARAEKMIMDKTNCDEKTAHQKLAQHNNVVAYAIDDIENKQK